jgi:hypothetical protein
MRRWTANALIQKLALGTFVCLLALFSFSQFKSISFWMGNWTINAAPASIGLQYSPNYIHWRFEVTDRSYFQGRNYYFAMPHVYPASPPGELLYYHPWVMTVPWWLFGGVLGLACIATAYWCKPTKNRSGFPIVVPEQTG